MILGGILGATTGLALRCDSGDSCRALACAAGEGGFLPACGMPRLDAMSLASEGDASRVRAFSLAAAIAEVVDGVFVGVASGEIGTAPLDLGSATDTGVPSLPWSLAVSDGREAR